MKPIHEQEWKKEAPGTVRVDDATEVTIHLAPWRLQRTPDKDEWKAAHEISETMTAAIVALPDMARTLLEVRAALEDDVIDTRVLGKAVESALRKAKVIP